MPDQQVSRRKFLTMSAGAAAVGAAGGVGGYVWPHSAHASTHVATRPATPPSPDVVRFESRPDLTPPRVAVVRRRSSATRTLRSRLFFLAPKGYVRTGPGTQGPLIVDDRGEVVWFLPSSGTDRVPMDFQVQTYQGSPVLTWWQGTSLNGHGKGRGVIVDSSYRQIATVEAAMGQQVDLHEFVLTPHGTALITAYRACDADLSSFGGPVKGSILSGIVQEIDVATGQLLFHWDSADHVALAESMTPPSATQKTPWDYFHINSIAEGADDTLLVSARNTCAIYRISRADGHVLWQLGGRRSSFTMGQGTRFYWQHDARPLSDGRISIFDDGSSPAREAQSRGIVLALDTKKNTVALVSEYVHPSRLLADNQGSVQVLDDGNVCVGWGAEPYFSVFDSSGALLLDARLPAGDQSYRSFSFAWTGRPMDDPRVAIGSNPARGATVYASWNGATEVDQWRVLAGKTASTLSEKAAAPRAGFETGIAVNDTGPYFAALALDRNGKALGRSEPIRSHA